MKCAMICSIIFKYIRGLEVLVIPILFHFCHYTRRVENWESSRTDGTYDYGCLRYVMAAQQRKVFYPNILDHSYLSQLISFPYYSWLAKG